MSVWGRIRERGRSLLITVSLAVVLLALAGYVLLGAVNTTRATEQQSAALVVDMKFTEARIAVAMQEVNLRHYQVEPSVAVRSRFERVADNAERNLTEITGSADEQTRQDAQRLLAGQLAYRRLAEQLIAKVADSDPDFMQFDRLQVTPTFYALQNDVDEASRSYHEYAQKQVTLLGDAQGRLLVGSTIGFAVGLTLVAMIMQMVLGYQRRLVAQAAHSRHQALHDPLTGLPNRALFQQELQDALARAERDGGQMAMMIIDLDGFKAVNDTIGHHAGDQVLIESGRRLSEHVAEPGVVARLGGDEFAVLLPRVTGPSEATALAERLVGELRRDFMFDDQPAAVGGSLGLALSPAHGPGDPDELLRHADTAMYRAKRRGGGVAVYDPGTDVEEQDDRMLLFAELRVLLETGDPDGQLQMHYQPQVRLRDGKVTSVEALVRWHHPARGIVMPAVLLPVAERGGLEVALTYHLLGVAAREASGWLRSGWRCRLSFNVSPGALSDDDFAETVLSTIGREGLPADLLRLELTEAGITADSGAALRTLRRVSESGVTVSVDDFGTGFSSLVQLRDLPADELKIDQTFVRNLTEGTPDAVMVRSSTDLGHNLGLQVVAEGVEDITTLVRLWEMTCDYAQGYVLSRPVPAGELTTACRAAEAIAAEAIGYARSAAPDGVPDRV
ncbi:EAL domain-containing protein [Actinoplanes sp. NEAU-A12]|uniref:EAL domain-containing protein n=1 Tax=Actinoplanes sandaracinus TaxID=3045177 RepID=A0ABT6WCJ1_9ACTN|nr:EAL domain-containing protein [Actinoplanes sandaracinus]MDI6097436.1 EAL domain-containing protein [Actinoplanes sandaracinus]